jgi:hypothetical protein
MAEPIFMKVGVYIMAPDSISTVHFIKPIHQSVCLCVYLPVVARHWQSKNITLTTNTHATTEEMLGTLFSVQSMSYQRGICVLCVYAPVLLGNGLAYTFLWQWGIVGGVIFYAVCFVWKESRWLVLPRTSCFKIKFIQCPVSC